MHYPVVADLGSSATGNGRNNDLWWMEPGRPGSEELLLDAPDGTWFGPADFSHDGRWLLVQQFVSVDDSRIYLLDLEERALYLGAGGDEQPSANKAIGFDRRDRGFYFITNQRGRSAELAYRPLDGEKETVFITRDNRWDVTDFVLSADGRRGALVKIAAGLLGLGVDALRQRDH